MENREQTPMRPSRRVGTFTFGVTLVIFGLWMLASLLLPEADLLWLLKLSPLVLVLLGAEVLLGGPEQQHRQIRLGGDAAVHRDRPHCPVTVRRRLVGDAYAGERVGRCGLDHVIRRGDRRDCPERPLLRAEGTGPAEAGFGGGPASPSRFHLPPAGDAESPTPVGSRALFRRAGLCTSGFFGFLFPPGPV